VCLNGRNEGAKPTFIALVEFRWTSMRKEALLLSRPPTSISCPHELIAGFSQYTRRIAGVG
jgi:hypothetical protein